jgi:hypothetical protein
LSYAVAVADALAVSITADLSLGDLIVGVGTAALAAMTYLLARKAGQEVDLARQGLSLTSDSIQVTRDSIEALDRPFLVATPQATTPSGTAFELQPTEDEYGEVDLSDPTGEWALFAYVQNHGRGPAILDGVSIHDEARQERVPGDWRVEMFLPPDEPAQLIIAGTWAENEPPEERDELILRLFYRSASGVRYETAHRLRVEQQHGATRLDFHRSLAPTRAE